MKIEDVKYKKLNAQILHEKEDNLVRFLRLAEEYGASEEADALYEEYLQKIDAYLDKFQKLVEKNENNDPEEPDEYAEILSKCPDGPRKLAEKIDLEDYKKRLTGAFIGRMIGCTLGAGLEFKPMKEARNWALQFTDKYPLTDYWPYLMRDPKGPHYIVGTNEKLTSQKMDIVPPDDDTMYTLLALVGLEKYGYDITQEEIAEIWKEYLPLGDEDENSYGMRGCFWGERIMLKELLKGVKLPEAGLNGNPNLQNIAAWTRADSYGYVCPGWPRKAAELAYKDASMNHRRNGVYGSMFMAATIAAAFVTDDPIEAVKIGLTEIPQNCMFAEAIKWCMSQKFTNYEEAHDIVWKKYAGMFNGSATTNAMHVVMGLMIGKNDFTKTIGETVAMSGDNDCTGATAGSILGAVIGIDNIPEHWYKNFNGKMANYLKNLPEEIEISEVIDRFIKVADNNGRIC